ncbi:MAG: toll/interleukin-1 receptor domain-containing protein [Anaerolineae bacterium]
MPIFISYSHSDKQIAEHLAMELVANNASIWLDRWELNIGDSILNRIQEAITEADALLIILSTASVSSEWCKKELTAGLMRELSEKRVIVLPVLVEDCEIPLFLRDKLYADLRVDFISGVKAILNAIASITNTNQSRILDNDKYVDWALEWGEINGKFFMKFVICDSRQNEQLTLFTEILIISNESADARYRQYVNADLDWMGRTVITEFIYDLGMKEDIRVILDDQFPLKKRISLCDSKSSIAYELIVTSRRLGVDNGKSIIVDISWYLKEIRDYIKSVTRKLTQEEIERLMHIIMT